MPVKPIPDGYHTVTPIVAVEGAKRVIEFLKAAVEATELSRLDQPDGKLMHAAVKVGDSIVMFGEAC